MIENTKYNINQITLIDIIFYRYIVSSTNYTG